MSTALARHVFVYGTLRRGEVNDINRRQPAPRFLGTARIPGQMFHLGRYPGVMLGGEGWVQGEVYEISAQLERQLDAIEEVYPQQSDEYLKRQQQVLLNGRHLDCLVYEINPRYVLGRSQISSGDWVEHRHCVGVPRARKDGISK